MAKSQRSALFQQLRGLVTGRQDSLPDVELLRQFLADHDEAAFAALVRRHEAMVLDVCRGVLRHQEDAEDVFQATFLVLARKAHAIRKHQSLGSWLHGVAYRLALRARARGGRWRGREPLADDLSSPADTDDLTVRELRGILHEEVHRLADRYRAALLLCYWDGLTRDEAAARLGMTSGAFKKCLERARNLLGGRLVRRGLVSSSALLPALLATAGVRAAPPSAVAVTIARPAADLASGKAAGVPGAALAKEMIRTMNLTKSATLTSWVVLLGGLGAGLGLGALHLLPGAPGGQAGAAQQGQPPAAKGKEPSRGKTDGERIIGTWRVTGGNSRGQALPKEFLALGRMTFAEDGTLTLALGPETKKSKYALAGPGKIDLGMGTTDQGLSPCIYKFDGDDRVTICVSEGGTARPTQFKSDPGSNQTVFELARARPGEEQPTAEEIARHKGSVARFRENAAREQSANQLRQIGIAMHNYHSRAKALPARGIYGKDGKTPLLSWRVAILPHLAQEKLYDEFKLDEPWDSAHNIKLLPKMPPLYAMPIGNKAGPGETYYQVVTGPGTLFDGPRQMTFAQITDGVSRTILVVEAGAPVPWTKPADLELPRDRGTRLPVGGSFAAGFNVVFCDGSSQFLTPDVPASTLRTWVTPAARD